MNPDRRKFLTYTALSMTALSLGACAGAPTARKTKAGPDAIVDAAFSGKAGSLVDGAPCYKTIQEALDAGPAFGGNWQILIRRGRYYEKPVVTASGVSLVGEDREQTILTFDAYAGQAKPGGSGVWGTNGCATLIVTGADFHAENLTVENGFDYLANDALDRNSATYIRGSQAVAVALTGSADRSVFRNVRLSGYQDTLWAGVGRAFFEKCSISGNVDFIFGAAQVWFENCEIITRPMGKPSTKNGYVTAPSTLMTNRYGFVFAHCRLVRESSKVPAHSTALGRPWHPSGDPLAVGSTVYLECWMDEHISDDGWDSMSSTTKSGQRLVFLPEDSRFFEYKSSGPGATGSAKRRQLTDAQRTDYTRDHVLDGWRP
jgi:pectinesterase